MLRSPPAPDVNTSLRTPPMQHFYASDSALNTSAAAASDDMDNLTNVTKRHKRKYGRFVGHSSPELKEVKYMFEELKTQNDSKLDSLSNAMATLIAQNLEIQKSLEHTNLQHEDLFSRFNSLTQENQAFRNKISTLENRVDLLEKQAQRCTIEIRNLPKIDKEVKQDRIEIVKNIALELGLPEPLYNQEISSAYRTKKDTLIVEFSTSFRQEEIVSGYKKFNKARKLQKEQPLSTAQIKIPGPPRPIYISEALSSKARHLSFLARECVRNKKLFASWSSFGKIYVKKEEGSAPIYINSEDELQKVTQ